MTDVNDWSVNSTPLRLFYYVFMDVTAPSGCINLAPQFSLFSTLVVKPFLFQGCEHVSNAMALTYSRSILLSLRSWWKNPTQLIKPLRHSEWTACKLAGILKPTRGTSGGIQRKIQADHRVNPIPTVISRRSQFNIGCLRAKGKHDSVNHGNLLNIQNHTSLTHQDPKSIA